jgi:hypothetical protein
MKAITASCSFLSLANAVTRSVTRSFNARGQRVNISRALTTMTLLAAFLLSSTLKNLIVNSFTNQSCNCHAKGQLNPSRAGDYPRLDTKYTRTMSDRQASDTIATTTENSPAPISGNTAARVPLGELKLFTPGTALSQSPSTPPSTWYSDDGILAPPGSPTSCMCRVSLYWVMCHSY